MKRYYIKCIIICCLFSTHQCGFTKNKEPISNKIIQLQTETKERVLKGSINFNDTLQNALEHSYDAKTALVNVEISKQQLSEARRDYLPTLNLRFNTEYSKGLDESKYGIYSVGDTIINENTKFQDAISLSLQHTIIDFGVKKNKIKIAKSDIEQKEILHIQTLRDLKIHVLNLYEKILSNNLELKNAQYQNRMCNEILNMKIRLYKAEIISKIEVEQARANLQKTLVDMENIKLSMCDYLAELSFYTGIKYDINNLDADLFNISDENINIDSLDYAASYEYKTYQKEIDKKQTKLLILKRQRLPNVALYSNYSLYGSDKDSYFSSLSDLSQSNLSVGFSTNLPLMEQFKQTPKIKELGLQIQNIKIAQAKETANFYKDVMKTKELISIYKSEKAKTTELIKSLNTKLSMIEKLDKERMINKTELYEEKIQNNTKKTEFLIMEQKTLAAVQKLKFLLENTNDTNSIYDI